MFMCQLMCQKVCTVSKKEIFQKSFFIQKKKEKSSLPAMIRILVVVVTWYVSKLGTKIKPTNKFAIVFPNNILPKASFDSIILNDELHDSQNWFCKSITHTSDQT